MELNELIKRKFIDSQGLQEQLARYNGESAVFSPAPPDDSMYLWNGNIHYPRIIFNYDMQASVERNTAGVLSVVLICQTTGEVIPELIELEIRKCLKDVILNPSDGSHYAFAWNRTDAFEMQDGNVGLLVGSEIRFDIMEYPEQETTDPDPIMALNSYIKELYPESIVVGLDRMEEVTVASRDSPIIYCMLETLSQAETMYACTWMNCRIAVHVLCGDSEVRIKMATAIAQRLSVEGEIGMLDGSPMRVTRLQADYRTDYMRNGQVIATMRFGILRHTLKKHKIASVTNTLKINFKEERDGKG